MQVLPERIGTRECTSLSSEKLNSPIYVPVNSPNLYLQRLHPSKSLIFKMIQQSVSTSWTLSPALPSSMTKVHGALFVTLPESSIGLYSRTQHECTSQNYSLFLVPNVWVLPKIKDAICNPKPIQKPHPLIMVGGSGEKYLLKVVARHADRYNLFLGSPDEMERKISLLKEYCSSIGRNYKEDIQYSVVLPCIIRESEDEVNKVLAQNKRKDKSMEEYSRYLVSSVMVGTPEKVLQGIRKYLDIGVGQLVKR